MTSKLPIEIQLNTLIREVIQLKGLVLDLHNLKLAELTNQAHMINWKPLSQKELNERKLKIVEKQVKINTKNKKN